MTRLEEHRKAFHVGGKLGALLRVEDLSHEETQVVYKTFVSHPKLAAAETNEDYCRVYCEVLNGFGVMCPHPVPFRVYDGWMTGYSEPIPFERQKWFRCQICDSICINR